MLKSTVDPAFESRPAIASPTMSTCQLKRASPKPPFLIELRSPGSGTQGVGVEVEVGNVKPDDVEDSVAVEKSDEY